MLPPSWQCASCPLKSCWQRTTGDVHPLGLFTSYLLLDVLLILSYSDVSRISRPSRKQAEWTENLSVDEDSFNGSGRKGCPKLSNPAHQSMPQLLMLFRADPLHGNSGAAWKGSLPHSQSGITWPPEGSIPPVESINM